MTPEPLPARARPALHRGPTESRPTVLRPPADTVDGRSALPARANSAPGLMSDSSVLWLQGAIGNAATTRLVDVQRIAKPSSLHPGWQKVTTPTSAVGFLYAPRVHFPPADLITRDPGMKLIRVRSGQNFWGLVKEQYCI
jgi:hypothetical protein